MKKCKVEGCNGVHKAKGYCAKHYWQIRKYGEILERTKYNLNEIIEYEDYAEVVLYNKDCEEVARAIIDLDDVDEIKKYKWCLNNIGYVINREFGLLHRLIMNPDTDMVVDHINHNKLDNRKSNLRICTKQQNNMNKKVRKDNTSGIKGIWWNKSRNKWTAEIMVNSKKHHLGDFSTKEEAAKARMNAEIEYFGEYRNQGEE